MFTLHNHRYSYRSLGVGLSYCIRALTFWYLRRAICTPQKYISTLIVYSQYTLEYKLCLSVISLTAYGSLRAPSYGLHVVHWRVPTEHSWRLLMTTWWITIELTKEYFSTLKDIQLFSTSSHCCAQLDSFWLRAMDSPWESNCTQHDSTDRYAIGITEVIRPVHRVVFRLSMQFTQRQTTTGKASVHNVVLMRVLTAILKYSSVTHVAHNGYCCSAVKKYHNVKLAWYTKDKYRNNLSY